MKIFWSLDPLSVNIITFRRLIAMPLYALDDDDFIFAGDAILHHSYRCLECSAPVKVRRGRDRVPHFYHLRRSPSCRLYSKSEDHLIVQLQLQRLIREETAEIERPFFLIHRIADLIWEKEKIAFEIQCSSLEIFEAEKRVIDYKKAGYDVVWLLDDRLFNKRFVRPAEEFLRTKYCYFFSFHRNGSLFYDQMEIILQNKRLKRGQTHKVDLSRPYDKTFFEWPQNLTRQLVLRIESSEIYFRGDLIEKVIRSISFPTLALGFERWHKTEIDLKKLNRPVKKIYLFFKRSLVCPYDRFLMWLIDRADRK
jgi:competence protein CoiA